MKVRILEALLEHHNVFSSLDSIIPDIELASQIIIEALRARHLILVCGNGGSAADSQHFVAELIGIYEKHNRLPYPAIALTTNTSTLTAISNDVGYNAVFSRAITALGNRGDVLLAITTSGKSANILNALDQATLQGMRRIVLCGENGIARKADCIIAVPHNRTSRIQEAHEFILHCLAENIECELG